MSVYSKDWTITATSGESNFTALPFPPRGSIRRVLAIQTAGAQEGYTVNLYDSIDVLPEADGGDPAVIPSIHRILPAQVAGEADAEVELLSDYGYPYANRDGNPSQAERFIYVDIAPGGTGDKTYHLVVTIDLPELVS